MKSDWLAFGRLKAFTLLGHNVQKARPFHGLHILQGGHQRMNVMSVNRADVIETKFLEKRTGHDHPFEMFLPAPGKGLHGRRSTENRFTPFTHTGVGSAGKNPGEVVGHRADIA